MKILNFSHPLTADQLKQLAARTGRAVAEIEEYRIPVQLNFDEPLVEQIVQLVPDRSIAVDDVIVNLPGFSVAAALLLLLLRQRFAATPISLLRLKSVAGAVGTSYEVAEIIVV